MNKLKKIIEYAVERGYGYSPSKIEVKRVPPNRGIMLAYFYGDNYIPSPQDYTLYEILFSHDFAKAVFGEETITYIDFESDNSTETQMLPGPVKSYVYHLQQAVISKDPIDYYYQFIKQEISK